MNSFLPYRNKLLVILFAFFMLIIPVVYSQRTTRTASKAAFFSKIAAEAGMVYTYPPGVKEIQPINGEDFSFDYALSIPGQDFEVWFHPSSIKTNWLRYERAQGQTLPNPDSAYLETGKATAATLSVDGTYFERNLTGHTLADYNADAGKTYLVSLDDSPLTRHYNYALIITLQKNHVGSLLAVCFTNDRGPEFFKNINRLKSCLKFK